MCDRLELQSWHATSWADQTAAVVQHAHDDATLVTAL